MIAHLTGDKSTDLEAENCVCGMSDQAGFKPLWEEGLRALMRLL